MGRRAGRARAGAALCADEVGIPLSLDRLLIVRFELDAQHSGCRAHHAGGYGEATGRRTELQCGRDDSATIWARSVTIAAIDLRGNHDVIQSFARGLHRSERTVGAEGACP